MILDKPPRSWHYALQFDSLRSKSDDPMTSAVIPFNNQERVLSKVRSYLSALDRLVQDGEEAVDLLVSALGFADNDLKLKIVLMLGTMPYHLVAWPLYKVMSDIGLNESIRHAAAVQLSLVGAQTRDNDALVDNLLADLGHPDPTIRANAAFALGWEGNQRAVPGLVDALCDKDMEVQQAAVSALSNIRDDRLFVFLADRLKRGGKEQQRCILYHLGEFSSRRKDVERICTRYLTHIDPDLRYDALVVLDAISFDDKPLHLYATCLHDKDERIREQALHYLAKADDQHLDEVVQHVHPLLTDHSPTIRQAAIRLMNMIYKGPVAV